MTLNRQSRLYELYMADEEIMNASRFEVGIDVKNINLQIKNMFFSLFIKKH